MKLFLDFPVVRSEESLIFAGNSRKTRLTIKRVMNCVLKGRGYIIWMFVGIIVLMMACAGGSERRELSELEAFESFFAVHCDSISAAPRWMRAEALKRMDEVDDSLVKYNYLSLTLKTYLMTSQIDSAWLVLRRIQRFAERQPFSRQVADLQSECLNMEGNLFARTGFMDSAKAAFQRAYERRMQGTRAGDIPDILMNLADACNRLGELDLGASWYRRALLLCDSLGLPSTKRTPIYYGLAQIYVALRDFDQCDYYYNLAGKGYDQMLPYEKYIYLNNRGTSYYYRDDSRTAMRYFRKLVELTSGYPDMAFEENLGKLNMSDCFLQMQEPDSAARYMDECRPFFQKIGMTTALYYLDTQAIERALLQRNIPEASRILSHAVTPSDIDPDMVHIRNKYLQQYYEETGNYRQAYYYQKNNLRLDDSIRNERIRMHTADLALRYQQDSTLLAHRVMIREAENKVLKLRQAHLIVGGIAIVAFLVAFFLYLYSKKKRALMQAESRRMVSSLRLENIRNRLSPHFIFNVLNQEMLSRKQEEQQELASLVKLMRRNLELAEQLCVTLEEELDFVKTYIDLERRSLGDNFFLEVQIASDVHPSLVFLPSMLIQIPVENAVKHALRGKEGEKRLWIDITRRTSGEVSIQITDNGGGYRPNSLHRGTGTGMKVIMQTIQILNAKNRQALDVEIHNVVLSSGETGCQVSFLLPVGYDYRL